MTAITHTIRDKMSRIIKEMNLTHKERAEVVEDIWSALVAKQHFLMLGKGGSGKSFIVRDVSKRIVEGDGSRTSYFETAFDETTTPDAVSGPPDIRSMVEDGKTRRVTEGYLPDAFIAFLDEFFNGNQPVLHHTMPMLNERIVHNGDQVQDIPLWSCFMGTNKLNADTEMAALFDRVHRRHVVPYVSQPENIKDLINEAVGRKRSDYIESDFTTVTVDELRVAHDEAMSLEVPAAVWDIFLDLLEQLKREGIEVSTRRQVEGMAAVLSTAWLNGNEQVKVGDLAVLRHMYWSNQDEKRTVQTVVLEACNPGEKRALEMLEDVKGLRKEYTESKKLDKVKINASAIEIFKRVGRLVDEATPIKESAEAAGAGIARLEDVLAKCEELKADIASEVFNLTPDQVKSLGTR